VAGRRQTGGKKARRYTFELKEKIERMLEGKNDGR